MVKVIGNAQLCHLINSGLARWRIMDIIETVEENVLAALKDQCYKAGLPVLCFSINTHKHRAVIVLLFYFYIHVSSSSLFYFLVVRRAFPSTATMGTV